MKITDRFVGDHKTFRKLMSEIEALPAVVDEGPQARRLVRLVELFVDHLIVHAWGEESFYYPAIGEALPEYSPAAVKRLESEHGDIDGLAQALESEAKKPGGGDWKAVYARFKPALSSHMKEEEEIVFPRSETVLGAPALEKISSDIESRRSEAPPIRRHRTF